MSKTPEKTGKRDQKGKTLSLDSLCTKELIDVKLDNEFEKGTWSTTYNPFWPGN